MEGLLSRISNKTNLIAFIVSEWKKAQCREMLREKVLYAKMTNATKSHLKVVWKSKLSSAIRKKQMDAFSCMLLIQHVKDIRQ